MPNLSLMENLTGTVVSLVGIAGFAYLALEANSQRIKDESEFNYPGDLRVLKTTYTSFMGDYSRIELYSPYQLEMSCNLCIQKSNSLLSSFYRNQSTNRLEEDSFFDFVDKITKENNLDRIVAQVPASDRIRFEIQNYEMTHMKLPEFISNLSGIRMEKKLI